MKEILQSIK